MFYDIPKWASTLYATEMLSDFSWNSLPLWSNYMNCSLLCGQFSSCPLWLNIKNFMENTIFTAEGSPFQWSTSLLFFFEHIPMWIRVGYPLLLLVLGDESVKPQNLLTITTQPKPHEFLIHICLIPQSLYQSSETHIKQKDSLDEMCEPKETYRQNWIYVWKK